MREPEDVCQKHYCLYNQKKLADQKKVMPNKEDKEEKERKAMSRPEWCKCGDVEGDDHEHETVKDGDTGHPKEWCCICGCTPTHKMKFSEMLSHEVCSGPYTEKQLADPCMLIKIFAKTLDHFLKPIDVPDLLPEPGADAVGECLKELVKQKIKILEEELALKDKLLASSDEIIKSQEVIIKLSGEGYKTLEKLTKAEKQWPMSIWSHK